ncbi:hypothetical protein AAL_03905 [Moelleriella libera RCEF 2490]|uniref:DUF2461 domain-containing protein n=1 Tax=Moelleriella libera RCEF 2490 TaxID=1081109 RepID=A0A168CJC4_9HYPO|nr:hypothetical protein AAL_03905 [Moelleriella libera RCEF 2490]
MPSRKRTDSGPASARRRSGRLSTSEHKSSYFEGTDEEDDGDGDAAPPARKRPRKTITSRTNNVDSSDDDEQYQDDSSTEDANHEEEEQEDDNDDDDDDAAPRKVQIIPLVKMRDTGGVDYADHKLHRNTLLFLKDLKANNKRSWLKSHDDEYRRALKDWQSFVEAATQTVIEADETVPELPIKDVIFRIYRDVRFSKIKTPYKPGSSFIGGGLWHPEAAFVAKLRRSIDRHPERWRRTLNEPLFRRVFFPQLKGKAGPEAAVKAFTGKNQENALKRRPMGFEVTHRDIELLKLRNYTVGTKMDADWFTKDDAQEKLSEVIRALRGFVTFLNSIIMPDPALDGEDSSSDDEGGEEAESDE